MRLVNLGPGELTDRLTILALKILYATEAGKPVDHFTTERNALLTMLRGRELNGSWFEQALNLAAVNAALWRAEDEIRDWRRQAGDLGALQKEAYLEVVLLAFQIQSLNDQRAALVAAINKLTGDHLGEEKL